jgi:hypothetical protein
MSKEVKGIIYLMLVVLQFYVGVVMIATPEKANLSHWLVVIFISVPFIYGGLFNKK